MATRKDKQDKYKSYLNDRVNPILEKLIVSILKAHPEDPVEFMIEWLKNNKSSFAKPHKTKHESDSENEEEEDEVVVDLPQIKALPKGSIKNQRHSVSAEAYGSWNKKGDFKPRVIAKTSDQKKNLNEKLSHSFMFSSLDQKDKEIVIMAMEEKKFSKGDTVIKQGDDGDVLYIVDKGELDCYKKYKNDEQPKHIKVYYPGESFGELALLYNAPRAASIVAKTDAILYALDRECFNNIVKEAAVKKREKYEAFLKPIDILEGMEPYERSIIAEALYEIDYNERDVVVALKQVTNNFYFVEEGKIIVKNENGITLKSIQTGGYFGEEALLSEKPSQYSYEVASKTARLVYLDKNSFRRLLGPVEEVIRRNLQKQMIKTKKHNKKVNIVQLS